MKEKDISNGFFSRNVEQVMLDIKEEGKNEDYRFGDNFKNAVDCKKNQTVLD